MLGYLREIPALAVRPGVSGPVVASAGPQPFLVVPRPPRRTRWMTRDRHTRILEHALNCTITFGMVNVIEQPLIE